MTSAVFQGENVEVVRVSSKRIATCKRADGSFFSVSQSALDFSTKLKESKAKSKTKEDKVEESNDE